MKRVTKKVSGKQQSAMDETGIDGLKSDDYREVCAMLAQELVAFSQRPMPSECLITDADDHIVLHVGFNQELKIRDVSELFGNPRLSARFPLTATITDAVGHAVELVIEPQGFVQH